MAPIRKRMKHKPFEKPKTETEIDFKRLRHEVFKFGLKGLNKTEKNDAKVAHAISLGAKPLKRKYKNYKQLMEENKLKKSKELEEKEINAKFGLKPKPKNKKYKMKSKDTNII